VAAAGLVEGSGRSSPKKENFAVTRTDAEWHKLLAPGQYAVLRQSATERPFTSLLLHEKRRGNFACAGCVLVRDEIRERQRLAELLGGALQPVQPPPGPRLQ
jgi:hypothetical protein